MSCSPAAVRTVLAVALAIATSLVTFAASANSGGVAGYTGKPNAAAPQGESCNNCHSGGATPTVQITGPATLTAGQVADYALVVSTGQTRAAGGVAATDGVVLTPGTGFRDSFGEMVQNASITPSGGQATFRFKVTAPMTGSAIKLWAVGLACNGSGTGGDRAAHTTRDITVTGGTAPKPDAGTGSSSSGGSSTSSSSSGGTTSSSSGGTTADGGTTATGAKTGGSSSGTAADPGDEDDGADDDGTGSRRLGGAEAGACASSPTSVGSGAMLGGMAVLGILAAARKRRSRRRTP